MKVTRRQLKKIIKESLIMEDAADDISFEKAGKVLQTSGPGYGRDMQGNPYKDIYIVQSGDTLAKIAEKTRTKISDLKALNWPASRDAYGNPFYENPANSPDFHYSTPGAITKGHSNSPNKLKVGGKLVLNNEYSLWPTFDINDLDGTEDSQIIDDYYSQDNLELSKSQALTKD